MAEWMLIFGGSIFALLGLLHGCYAILDIGNPRRLAPMDSAVVKRMASTGVVLSRGRTNMWDAWLGFNLSHSLGATVFGSVCIGAGVFARSLGLPKSSLGILVLVGLIYLILAARFWFRVPVIGIALGTSCLIAGLLLY